jgi:zinc protease
VSAELPVLASKAGASVRETRLENGLSVLLLERHMDPVVAVILWYRVGARDEDERVAGVSHFLEHMMFKGSARFGKGEVDRVTTLLGGTNNAFTTSDHTAYWFELASDRWEAALEIESDRMRALLLDPAEFTAEKAVVLEELAMGQDDPWRRLTELVQDALFGRHPYRRPIIGHADALQRLSVDEMRAHYQRHYRPGNAVLVVCGDFQPERALELVRRHFGDIAPPPLPAVEPFRPAPAEPAGERRLSMRWDDAGQRLCVAWPGAKVGSDDDWALDVLATVLTGGRLSRLHRRLVLERGLATSVSTQNDARVEAGAFWLFAECAQGVRPEAASSCRPGSWSAPNASWRPARRTTARRSPTSPRRSASSPWTPTGGSRCTRWSACARSARARCATARAGCSRPSAASWPGACPRRRRRGPRRARLARGGAADERGDRLRAALVRA